MCPRPWHLWHLISRLRDVDAAADVADDAPIFPVERRLSWCPAGEEADEGVGLAAGVDGDVSAGAP